MNDYAEHEEDILVHEITSNLNLDSQILTRYASERAGWGRDGWETF